MRCRTHELLPRRGETDEGRPLRRRHRLCGARARRHPSLSTNGAHHWNEQYRSHSLSQRRLVNTNKPRSRDKIFVRPSLYAHERARRSRHEPPHIRAALRIARRSAPRVLLLIIFSRKLTCSVVVATSRPPATCSFHHANHHQT